MQQDIKSLEEQYWQGMVDHDFLRVKSLTQFPCFVTGKSGPASIDENTYKKMFESHAHIQITVNSISNVNTRALSDTTAIIIYSIEMLYDEKIIKCACSSTWVKENGNWKCAMHSETEIKSS